jgi:hypothetical protein
MMRCLMCVIFCIQIAVLSGCAGLDLPVEISATNNEHKPLLYSELDDVTATETSFTGEFVFQNKSPESLPLRLKTTSCGCLSLQREGQELKQGDILTIPGKGRVAVSMTMQMPLHPGNNRYHALFVSEFQGRECETEIAMSCPIVDGMIIHPRTVQVSFDRDTATSKQFSVRTLRSSRNKNDLEPLPAHGGLPGHVALQKISVVSKPAMVAEGIWQKEWQLDFTVKPPEDMGLLVPPQPISLCAADKTADFSLVLAKNYGVDAPRQIDFPDTKLTEKRSRVFSLQSATDSTFTIRSMSCENPCFVVSASPGITDTEQHWVTIVFQPQTAGENRSALHIETTHSDSEHIHIELAGTAFVEP